MTKTPSHLTHGKSNTRLYTIYNNMKTRCYNKNSDDYKNYGERGITVCKEWLNSFTSFYNWSINNGYKPDLLLDRKDNDLGYSPENCRWVDSIEQNNNKRNNNLIEYNGKTQSISRWSAELGIKRVTLLSRLRNGWSVERAFSTPAMVQYRNSRSNGGI